MARPIYDLEQMLERLDIPFERKGDRLWSCCPFHNENTPSFFMWNEPGEERHGRYFCFGCQQTGRPVNFVANFLDTDKQSARKWLKNMESAAPQPLNVEMDMKPEAFFGRRFKLPSGVVDKPLEEWSSIARNYVLNDRHLTAEQVARWRIGYAVGGRCNGRIVIPIYDANGKLIGYTARTFIGHDRKYLEPAEKEGAKLGAVFGAIHWPHIDRRDTVVVTEGGFNALACERASAGQLPIAAIFGSHVHPGHLVRLSTFKCVLLATDPDQAGNRVAKELREQLTGCEVERVDIPSGHDCDDLPRADLHQALLSAYEQSADRHRPGLPARKRRRRAVRRSGT